MTTQSVTARKPEAAQLPRSRLRARLVLAGFAAVGLAALAWAAFVQPLPRLIYNPSDSVPVGWYRVQPLDHRAASLPRPLRSEEHTSELQSLMRISYAVFCLKKKKNKDQI